jgi:microcystin-dependent protein
VPLHQGGGAGLSPRTIGSAGGSEQVSLTQGQLPAHTHTWQGTSAPATETQPGGNVVAGNVSVDTYVGAPAPTAAFDAASVADAGSGAPSGHANMQPYIALHYIIALAGVFPSRS